METPAIFGRGSSLLGMISTPPVPRQHPVPVLFLNAGILHRVGPHRLHVLLARRLAEHGVPSLRFDLGGIGDSNVPESETGSVLDATQRDIDDAISRAVDEWDAERVVLFGLCSGADVAYETALIDDRVKALVQFDPYVYRTPAWYLRHYGPRVFSARNWIHSLRVRIRALGSGAGDEGSPDFVAPEYRRVFPPRDQVRKGMATLMSRGVRMFVCFTGDEPHINHRGQYAQGLGLPSGALLEVEYVPQADHTFTHPDHQRWLAARVTRWSRECFLPEARGGVGVG